MLDGLDTIDWSKLSHAYGSARDVPGLIQSLASSRKRTRDAAIYKLYGNIWHQGTVYEATAYAVPFLIELLEAPQPEEKEQLLLLLSHIATGNSYHDVHQHLPLFGQLHGDDMKTAEWKAKVKKELSWVKDTREAVKRGGTIYIGFLKHENSQVRDAAAHLIARLGGPDADGSKVLAERFGTEKNNMVKASLLLAFATLSKPAQRKVLPEYLKPEHAKVIQLAASICLVKTNPGDVSENVVRVLLDAVQHPDGYSDIERSQWADGHTVVSLASRYLQGLRGEAALQAERALSHALNSQKHFQAISVANALVELAFQEPVPRGTTFEALDERQRRVLMALASTRHVWGVQSGKDFIENVDTMSLMRCYGLPDRLVKLEAYIRGEPEVVEPPKPIKEVGLVAKITRLFKR